MLFGMASSQQIWQSGYSLLFLWWTGQKYLRFNIFLHKPRKFQGCSTWENQQVFSFEYLRFERDSMYSYYPIILYGMRKRNIRGNNIKLNIYFNITSFPCVPLIASKRQLKSFSPPKRALMCKQLPETTYTKKCRKVFEENVRVRLDSNEQSGVLIEI